MSNNVIQIGSVIEESIVRIPLNTIDSAGGSVTVTNLLPANIHIHKNGELTQRSSSNGMTTVTDYDGVTGNHLITIDLSDNSDPGFYEQGADYAVRIQGLTVAGQTRNIWIAKFQIGFALWDEDLRDHMINNTAGRKLRQLADTVLLIGTSPNLIGNTSISIELNGDASTVDGAYDPGIVSIISGTGVGQSRKIYEYDGAQKLCYVERDWKVLPDDTSEYMITADSGGISVNEGKLQLGSTSTTAALNTLASGIENAYIGQIIFISAGVGSDQVRRIIAYDNINKVVTVNSAWDIIPTDQSVYSILPIYWSVLLASDFEIIADYVWDEPMSGHITTGTAGAFIDFIKSVNGGRWRILGSVLIMYAEDNITEIARFNLIDDGTNIIERARI